MPENTFRPVFFRPDREEARELRGLYRAAVALEHQLAVAREQFAIECRRLVLDRFSGTPKSDASFDYDPTSGLLIEKQEVPAQGVEEPHIAADPAKPDLTRGQA